MPRGGARPGAGRPKKLSETQRLIIALWIEESVSLCAIEAHVKGRATRWVKKTDLELRADEEAVHRRLQALNHRAPLMNVPEVVLTQIEDEKGKRLDKRCLTLPKGRLSPARGAISEFICKAAQKWRISKSTVRKAWEFKCELEQSPDGKNRVGALRAQATPKNFIEHVRRNRLQRLEDLFFLCV